jgi:hypothetical protein
MGGRVTQKRYLLRVIVGHDGEVMIRRGPPGANIFINNPTFMIMRWGEKE